MGKKEKSILAKLKISTGLDEASIEGSKEIQRLLKFSFVEKRTIAEESRVEIGAILVAAIGHGMPPKEAEELKKALIERGQEQASKLLEELNNPLSSPKAVFARCRAELMVENQVGARLTPVDPKTIPEVTIKPSTLVTVLPETVQNLGVAHAVNFAVKSIITDGTPNQAPDLYRTSGRNFFLYNNVNHLASPLDTDRRYLSEHQRAEDVDKQRRDLVTGEHLTNVVEKSQTTAAIGTGKCAEHAATSFAILADPSSLAKLGVELAEGSTVILALGDEIDHNYVLVAGPGAVEIQDDKRRTVSVKDPDNVAVVDPWMPIPCAHTLSRCNKEIQTDPGCKLAVVVKGGKPVVLDRGGEETPIPDAEVPVLDQLNAIKEDYRRSSLKTAVEEGLVPKDKSTCLAHACGEIQRLVSAGVKPPSYTTTHLSTDTPQDKYQCVTSTKTYVGVPATYFVADQRYLATEHQFIDQAKKTSVESIAFDPKNLKRMPKELDKSLREFQQHKLDKGTLKASPEEDPAMVVERMYMMRKRQGLETGDALPQEIGQSSPKVERINALTHAKPRVRGGLPQEIEQSSPKVDRVNSNARAKPRVRDALPREIGQSSPKVDRVNSNTRAKPRGLGDPPQESGQSSPEIPRIDSNAQAQPRLRDIQPDLVRKKNDGAEKQVTISTSGIK